MKKIQTLPALNVVLCFLSQYQKLLFSWAEFPLILQRSAESSACRVRDPGNNSVTYCVGVQCGCFQCRCECSYVQHKLGQILDIVLLIQQEEESLIFPVIFKVQHKKSLTQEWLPPQQHMEAESEAIVSFSQFFS